MARYGKNAVIVAVGVLVAMFVVSFMNGEKAVAAILLGAAVTGALSLICGFLSELIDAVKELNQQQTKTESR